MSIVLAIKLIDFKLISKNLTLREIKYAFINAIHKFED